MLEFQGKVYTLTSGNLYNHRAPKGSSFPVWGTCSPESTSQLLVGWISYRAGGGHFPGGSPRTASQHLRVKSGEKAGGKTCPGALGQCDVSWLIYPHLPESLLHLFPRWRHTAEGSWDHQFSPTHLPPKLTENPKAVNEDITHNQSLAQFCVLH